jgi:hypothetical protein
MERWKSVKPGGLTASQARAGRVVAWLLLLAGVTLVAVVWVEEAPSSEIGLAVAQGAFLLVWIAGCGAIIRMSGRVIAAAGGTGEDSLLEIRSSGPDRGGDAGVRADPEARLRRLEALRRDGLLSEEEFRAKREEALRDL